MLAGRRQGICLGGHCPVRPVVDFAFDSFAPLNPFTCPFLLPLGSYLVRTVAMKSLILQETLPPLDELQKFNAAAQVGGAGAACLVGTVGPRAAWVGSVARCCLAVLPAPRSLWVPPNSNCLLLCQLRHHMYPS